MMDHPRYIPPVTAGIRPLQAPQMSDPASMRSQEFQLRPEKESAAHPEDVAPSSIVALLIGVVIVLVVVIIYLLYRQHAPVP
jgi:hypothetical protein